jgi:hypothetical protein
MSTFQSTDLTPRHISPLSPAPCIPQRLHTEQMKLEQLYISWGAGCPSIWPNDLSSRMPLQNLRSVHLFVTRDQHLDPISNPLSEPAQVPKLRRLVLTFAKTILPSCAFFKPQKLQATFFGGHQRFDVTGSRQRSYTETLLEDDTVCQHEAVLLRSLL